MKTLLLILSLATAAYSESGIIRRDVDAAHMIIFRDTVPEHHGKVTIGKNVTIVYWVRTSKGQRSRYLAMDASGVQSKFNPVLTEGGQTPPKWNGGFLVRDTSQSRLDIFITPRLWSKSVHPQTKEQLRVMEQKLSREANMSVTFQGGRGKPVQVHNILIN